MSTASVSVERDEWLSATQVCRMYGIGRPNLKRLVDKGYLGVKQFPGTPARYRASDVRELLAGSIRPAVAGVA